MKKATTKLILGLLAGLFCLLPISAMAEDNPPPLSETWMVTPKAGQIGEFQAAHSRNMENSGKRMASHGSGRSTRPSSVMISIATRFAIAASIGLIWTPMKSGMRPIPKYSGTG